MDNEPNDAPPILIPFLIRGHNHEDADRFMDSISPNTRFRRLYFAAYFVADFCDTLGREVFNNNYKLCVCDRSYCYYLK